jgi:hypothetical protein
MVPLAACDPRGRRRDRDKIDLEQAVTIDRRPKDPVFADFAKKWRQFISESPELTKAVFADPRKPPREPWVPVVTPDCVFSPDAGGQVPQVTLIWNEPLRTDPGPGAPPAKQLPAAQQEMAEPGGPAETPTIRFDLALHQNGFGRNYYTAILASDRLQRFMLPSNSGLVNDTEAVLLTGPGLFPRLMDFRTQVLVDAAVRERFLQHTMVLQDLSQGLTYAIRLDRPANEQWSEEKRFAFLTPICPQEF